MGGTTSVMTRAIRVPTAGEKTVRRVSPMTKTTMFRDRPLERSDPILKERLFGLTNSEGNHGEDVKEYYFYLDTTPTHSFMKYLYKSAEIPIRNLVETNRSRSREEFEHESTRHWCLMPTGTVCADHEPQKL